MKIGIIEIMPLGHYTLVDSLARIFGSDPMNEVYIFTQKKGHDILSPVIHEIKAKVQIVFKNDNESVLGFLNKIQEFQLDRVYIVTLEKYYKEIIRAKFICPVHLFVHNIEDWFRLTPGILLYRFIAGLKIPGYMLYNFKICFVYPFYKLQIIKKIIVSGGKFVVLNKLLKKELEAFTKPDKIEVIPFSVYNSEIVVSPKQNKLIRICIPGRLDNVRRDYFSLFKALESDINFFKNRIELDLLGGIAYKQGGAKIIEECDKLIKKGLVITYYTNPFIPMAEFDEQLARADIMMGNMKVELNKYSSYGKTKDSGIIFNMVRVAKPGILPNNYALIDELKSSSLIFSNYREFAILIRRLINEPELLQQLSFEARKNSLLFEPSAILKTLV